MKHNYISNSHSDHREIRMQKNLQHIFILSAPRRPPMIEIQRKPLYHYNSELIKSENIPNQTEIMHYALVSPSRISTYLLWLAWRPFHIRTHIYPKITCASTTYEQLHVTFVARKILTCVELTCWNLRFHTETINETENQRINSTNTI